MLARLRKAQENNEGGFTLIELLVVMIIIGILAAIAIPAFLNQKKKASETSAKSDATNISKEIAAALVDGNLESASLTNPCVAPSCTLTTKTTADSGNQTAVVKVSNGNKITIALLKDDGTAFVAGAGLSTTNYCITAAPVTADAYASWSAGPNGLKKGATC